VGFWRIVGAALLVGWTRSRLDRSKTPTSYAGLVEMSRKIDQVTTVSSVLQKKVSASLLRLDGKARLSSFCATSYVPGASVLYDIDEEQHAVQIMAVGEKEGIRLIVDGEEVEL
jgi:hypothetical protein